MDGLQLALGCLVLVEIISHLMNMLVFALVIVATDASALKNMSLKV